VHDGAKVGKNGLGWNILFDKDPKTKPLTPEFLPRLRFLFLRLFLIAAQPLP
jgi:hypothetical protein